MRDRPKDGKMVRQAKNGRHHRQHKKNFIILSPPAIHRAGICCHTFQKSVLKLIIGALHIFFPITVRKRNSKNAIIYDNGNKILTIFNNACHKMITVSPGELRAGSSWYTRNPVMGPANKRNPAIWDSFSWSQFVYFQFLMFQIPLIMDQLIRESRLYGMRLSVSWPVFHLELGICLSVC